MKRIWILFAMALTLSACGNNTTTPNAPTTNTPLVAKFGTFSTAPGEYPITTICKSENFGNISSAQLIFKNISTGQEINFKKRAIAQYQENFISCDPSGLYCYQWWIITTDFTSDITPPPGAYFSWQYLTRPDSYNLSYSGLFTVE